MLKALLELCTFEVPTMKMVPKKDSALMRFLGKVLFFVPNFMTNYTTAIGDTLYLPDSILAALEEENPRIAGLLAHETMHLLDRKKYGTIPYAVMYLLPQLGALLALLSLLAIWFGSGWLWCLAFLAFLAPIPSPGRAHIEKRGYLMTLAWHRWQYGDDKPVPGWVLENFTGPAYYFMWPFGVNLEKWLNDKYELMKQGIFISPWAEKFYHFLEEHKDAG
jgi:hypothetical protein